MLFLGNINASLMSLRTCMEVLRENQGNAENGVSPKVCLKVFLLSLFKKKNHMSVSIKQL